MEIRLKTLTPLWTGGVEGTCDRLHETGIIGSLRWWYEALVRGLGGSACDPTNYKCQDRKHCVACELFGCTGWKRKFRLNLEYRNSDVTARGGLKAGVSFTLRFHELKPLSSAEKWLLARSVEIACKYGAIGGKKTLKPQRNQSVGKDFGLVEVEENINHEPLTLDEVRKFCRGFKVDGTPSWPNLRGFFFVPGHFLWRAQMNSLMNFESFLKSPGSGTSKKLFSFQKHGGRIWGYVDDEAKLKRVKGKLEEYNISPDSIIVGLQVFDKLAREE